MNNLTGHEKLKCDCVAYFRQNEIWQRIFTGFREKYSSYGRFSGKVTVKNISGDGLDTLEGFFCQNFHGKKSITVSAEKFRKALSCSKYGTVTPEEVLAEYFGKALIGKAEEKAFKENQIREIKKEFLENFKGTPAFLEFDTFENILKSSDKENLKEWKRLLWLCANLYNALPYRTQKSVYLAVFAAAVTGNPHAFDQGTAEGKILYQVIQMDLGQRGIQVETLEMFPAYKRQKSYLLAGILIDDISNYALLYNVHAIKKNGELHRGMDGFCQEKNMVQVPLTVLSEWERIECVDHEIFIVENPSVFALICGEKSCMCMNGQPRLAGLLVLELLAKSGTKVYYSGDLDPEGILIAQKLSQYYRGTFCYWHMTPFDYEQCRSKEIISEKRKKMLQKITDERLLPVVDAVTKYGMAGYQESIGLNQISI